MAPIRKPPAVPSRRSERMQLATAIKVSEQEVRAPSPRLAHLVAQLTSLLANAKSGVTKKKRFRRPKQRASCRLLNLPGEIRNHIYRLVLVQLGAIEIDTKGPGEPSLLRVCRRARTEARSIYYTENHFTLQVVNYNGAEFLPFIRQYNRFGHLLKKETLIFNMSGQPNWPNLVAWVKADHEGADMRPSMGDCATANDYVLAGAFGLSQTMRCLPSSFFLEALKDMHKCLAATPWSMNPNWYHL